jgi:hypothetical protein
MSPEWSDGNKDASRGTPKHRRRSGQLTIGPTVRNVIDHPYAKPNMSVRNASFPVYPLSFFVSLFLPFLATFLSDLSMTNGDTGNSYSRYLLLVLIHPLLADAGVVWQNKNGQVISGGRVE